MLLLDWKSGSVPWLWVIWMIVSERKVDFVKFQIDLWTRRRYVLIAEWIH